MSSKTTNIIRKSWWSCLQYYHIIISIVFHSAIWISRHNISTAQHMETLYQVPRFIFLSSFSSRKFLIIMWNQFLSVTQHWSCPTKITFILYNSRFSYLFYLDLNLYHVGSGWFRKVDQASGWNIQVPSLGRCQDWQHRLQTALHIQVKNIF